eukprot:CAMPEP_0194078960 /NCGR_PEP_ID=MMETSP0149-20130528/5242_1 /TAXON_ID=122233 /ORGANISM="Chaetoceros debilis, Strain MM31A-1" /LENGTH=539 /DNA_ID=CAMNT_0038760317 /DNA_START=109 /DNA_END=1728 /DNA_ORIENTATION=-
MPYSRCLLAVVACYLSLACQAFVSPIGIHSTSGTITGSARYFPTTSTSAMRGLSTYNGIVRNPISKTLPLELAVDAKFRLYSDLSDTDREDINSDSSLEAPPRITEIVSAALLVAGTTVGGGFLALPSVVARSGFYPSTTILLSVWVYFLSQSFILVECINRTKQQQQQSVSSTSSPPGVAAVAKSVFGTKGEVVIGILLAVLIEATLVSQISRVGMLFPNYAIGCIISAFSIAAIVFGPKSGISFASKANTVLTTLFLSSAACVFASGVGIADWSRLGSSTNWAAAPSVLPTFLQLLVYGEILPTICQLLKYSTKHIYGAITFGSFLTLCLQMGWSALGIALVPDALSLDPVNVLLAGSGPVKIPLFALAITAILTTILGSYLALLSTANDFINKGRTAKGDDDDNDDASQPAEEIKEADNSFGQRVKVGALITVPATMIASTSPSVFLKAIDFAGSYPVLLLWGVIPPMIAIVQRKRESESGSGSGSGGGGPKSNDIVTRTSGPSGWLLTLGAISLVAVGINAIQDVTSFASKILLT